MTTYPSSDFIEIIYRLDLSNYNVQIIKDLIIIFQKYYKFLNEDIYPLIFSSSKKSIITNFLKYIKLYKTVKNKYCNEFSRICEIIKEYNLMYNHSIFNEIFKYYETKEEIYGYNPLNEPYLFLQYYYIQKYMYDFIDKNYIEVIFQQTEFFEYIEYIEDVEEIFNMIDEKNYIKYEINEDYRTIFMFIKIYYDFEERNIEIINKIRIIKKIYDIKIDEIIKKIEMIKQITFMPPNESGTFIGGVEYHNAFQRYNQTIALID